jgi:hypothetical protein
MKKRQILVGILVIVVSAALIWAVKASPFRPTGFLQQTWPVLVSFTVLILAWVFIYRAAKFESWRQEDRDLVMMGTVFLGALLGGILLVTGGESLADPSYYAFRIIALWAVSYFAAGFLIGFLFGIPRVLQSDSGKQNTQSGDYAQRVNTNLEQISDWLTKIIVGLGLVQLRRVPDYLYNASTWMARSFTPKGNSNLEAAASFSSSVIVFFPVVGFLTGYLITRVYLPGVLRRSETPPIQTQLSGIAMDDPAKKLRDFWKPDGVHADAGCEGQLLDWMQKNGLRSPEKSVDIASFLVGPQYAKEREHAVKDLKIS